MKFLDKRYLQSAFVLFVCFMHIIFWILVNQVRLSIRDTEAELYSEEQLKQKKMRGDRRNRQEAEFEI